MADCKKYRDLISCYTDNELSGSDKNELLKHIQKCASCKALLTLYTTISKATAESLIAPPETLAKNIMDKIRTPSAPPEKEQEKAHEKEQITAVVAVKPWKRLKPVLITAFLGIALCLQLIAVLRPTFLTYENPTATLSNAARSSASSEAAIQAPMAASDSKASAASSGDPEMGADAALQAAPPESQNTPSASMLPAAGQAAVFTDEEIASPAELAKYYAVFAINGTLPDTLKDYAMIDNSDGTFNLEIPTKTANQLINDGFIPKMGAPEMTLALVKYTPAA